MISDYLAKKILDYVFSEAAYNPGANYTLKLYTVAPGPSGGGTVVSASGYADKTIANDATSFPASTLASGLKYLNVEQSWTAAADWGTVVAWSLYDGSDMLVFAELDTPITVNNGDTFKFVAGAAGLRITVS